MYFNFGPLAVFTVLLTHLTPTTGQILTAEYLDVKLPHANGCPLPFYDEYDTIYFFGGCSDDTYTNILKFTVSTDTLEEIGVLPGRGQVGTVQSDGLGNIFYFGGGDLGTQVYVFNTTPNSSNTVATLPNRVRSGISMKYNDSYSTVFILGGVGQNGEMLAFYMDTLNVSTVSTIVEQVSELEIKRSYLLSMARGRQLSGIWTLTPWHEWVLPLSLLLIIGLHLYGMETGLTSLVDITIMP